MHNCCSYLTKREATTIKKHYSGRRNLPVETEGKEKIGEPVALGTPALHYTAAAPSAGGFGSWAEVEALVVAWGGRRGAGRWWIGANGRGACPSGGFAYRGCP